MRDAGPADVEVGAAVGDDEIELVRAARRVGVRPGARKRRRRAAARIWRALDPERVFVLRRLPVRDGNDNDLVLARPLRAVFLRFERHDDARESPARRAREIGNLEGRIRRDAQQGRLRRALGNVRVGLGETERDVHGALPVALPVRVAGRALHALDLARRGDVLDFKLRVAVRPLLVAAGEPASDARRDRSEHEGEHHRQGQMTGLQ